MVSSAIWVEGRMPWAQWIGARDIGSAVLHKVWVSYPPAQPWALTLAWLEVRKVFSSFLFGSVPVGTVSRWTYVAHRAFMGDFVFHQSSYLVHSRDRAEMDGSGVCEGKGGMLAGGSSKEVREMDQNRDGTFGARM